VALSKPQRGKSVVEVDHCLPETVLRHDTVVQGNRLVGDIPGEHVVEGSHGRLLPSFDLPIKPLKGSPPLRPGPHLLKVKDVPFELKKFLAHDKAVGADKAEGTQEDDQRPCQIIAVVERQFRVNFELFWKCSIVTASYSEIAIDIAPFYCMIYHLLGSVI